MWPWRGVVTLFCVTSAVLCAGEHRYRPIDDSSRVCLATHSKHLDNDFLIGRWYYVYRFVVYLNLPPSTECREIMFERPTPDNLTAYKNTYNLTGMPYTFKEDMILYSESWSRYCDGLLFGGREAKIFLEFPKKFTYPERYVFKVFRVINKDYIVHEDCSLRGFAKWLISRKKHPSVEELQEIIDSQEDLVELETQRLCDLEPE